MSDLLDLVKRFVTSLKYTNDDTLNIYVINSQDPSIDVL